MQVEGQPRRSFTTVPGDLIYDNDESDMQELSTVYPFSFFIIINTISVTYLYYNNVPKLSP